MTFQPATPEAWDAIASPIRLEILQTLEGLGPCSIPTLAELLGRRPEGLYHHMRLLLKVGAVFEVESEKRGRRPERRFAMNGPMDFSGPLEPGPSGAIEGLSRLCGSITRAAERQLSAALATFEGRELGELGGFSLRSESARLSPQGIRDLERITGELRELFERERAAALNANDDEPRRLHHAAWVSHPRGLEDDEPTDRGCGPTD